MNATANKGNTMTTVKQVRDILSNSDASTEMLVSLNHWAVGYFRNWARDNGYNLVALGTEEAHRVQGRTLDQYLTCSRIGSKFRMNRKARLAVYAALVTGDALKARGY